MPEPDTITKSKSPSANELKDRIRELELELAAYRVYGTPLDIAIALAHRESKPYNTLIPSADQLSGTRIGD